MIATALVMNELFDALDPDWSRAHITVLGLFGGAVTWLVVEVVLAWVAALWETQHAHLLRDKGLPVAQLLRRRRA